MNYLTNKKKTRFFKSSLFLFYWNLLFLILQSKIKKIDLQLVEILLFLISRALISILRSTTSRNFIIFNLVKTRKLETYLQLVEILLFLINIPVDSTIQSTTSRNFIIFNQRKKIQKFKIYN